MSVGVIDGAKLRALIDERGYSVCEFAAQIGTNQTRLRRMLEGGKVQDETLWLIADVLGVDILALMPYSRGQLTTGQAMHLARLEAGVTVEELSRSSGLCEQSLVRYENDSIPKLDQAYDIAKALGMTIDEVFFRRI